VQSEPSSTYRVELLPLASRSLRAIYKRIEPEHSAKAADWFNDLTTAILELDQYPARCPVIPEDENVRHLLYGNKPDIYRILFEINEGKRLVTVLNIRHSAQRPLVRK